jgi:hypothetical protein
VAERASDVQIWKDVAERHEPQAKIVRVFARQIAMHKLAVKRGGAGFGEVGRFGGRAVRHTHDAIGEERCVVVHDRGRETNPRTSHSKPNTAMRRYGALKGRRLLGTASITSHEPAESSAVFTECLQAANVPSSTTTQSESTKTVVDHVFLKAKAALFAASRHKVTIMSRHD